MTESICGSLCAPMHQPADMRMTAQSCSSRLYNSTAGLYLLCSVLPVAAYSCSAMPGVMYRVDSSSAVPVVRYRIEI